MEWVIIRITWYAHPYNVNFLIKNVLWTILFVFLYLQVRLIFNQNISTKPAIYYISFFWWKTPILLSWRPLLVLLLWDLCPPGNFQRDLLSTLFLQINQYKTLYAFINKHWSLSWCQDDALGLYTRNLNCVKTTFRVNCGVNCNIGPPSSSN